MIKISYNRAWRKNTNYIIGMICKAVNDYRAPRYEIYKIVQARTNRNLRTELKRFKDKALIKGMAPPHAKQLNFLDLIERDCELREVYSQAVNEIAVKYGVSI
ncbi:hypothetical protein [Clostridium brassicae]|uniref:Uncharacterized protein n=1 Tax=Clostridium brassicae TaxID=2999072 RepID=A0ABT4DBJ9_9CLOT|nr:hypothetical protein [Clostridium brassicae]MCY6958414.1 hypothetical protein [Clostridium brassicae]